MPSNIYKKYSGFVHLKLKTLQLLVHYFVVFMFKSKNQITFIIDHKIYECKNGSCYSLHFLQCLLVSFFFTSTEIRNVWFSVPCLLWSYYWWILLARVLLLWALWLEPGLLPWVAWPPFLSHLLWAFSHVYLYHFNPLMRIGWAYWCFSGFGAHHPHAS